MLRGVGPGSMHVTFFCQRDLGGCAGRSRPSSTPTASGRTHQGISDTRSRVLRIGAGGLSPAEPMHSISAMVQEAASASPTATGVARRPRRNRGRASPSTPPRCKSDRARRFPPIQPRHRRPRQLLDRVQRVTQRTSSSAITHCSADALRHSPPARPGTVPASSALTQNSLGDAYLGPHCQRHAGTWSGRLGRDDAAARVYTHDASSPRSGTRSTAQASPRFCGTPVAGRERAQSLERAARALRPGAGRVWREGAPMLSRRRRGARVGSVYAVFTLAASRPRRWSRRWRAMPMRSPCLAREASPKQLGDRACDCCAMPISTVSPAARRRRHQPSPAGTTLSASLRARYRRAGAESAKCRFNPRGGMLWAPRMATAPTWGVSLPEVGTWLRRVHARDHRQRIGRRRTLLQP